jgi:ADP-ribose pyrophosphatase YjhB (NUDIX family)
MASMTRIDIAFFTVRDFWIPEEADTPRLEVAIVPRTEEAFRGRFGLPCTTILSVRDARGRIDHTDQDAVERLIAETLRMRPAYLEQVYASYSRGGDPRGPVTSIGYVALAAFDADQYADRRDLTFLPIQELPNLAFNHKDLVSKAYDHIRAKATHSTLPMLLMPEHFTLREARSLYGTLLSKQLDAANFSRKIEQLDVVKQIDASLNAAQEVMIRARPQTGRVPRVYRLKQYLPVDFEMAAF